MVNWWPLWLAGFVYGNRAMSALAFSLVRGQSLSPFSSVPAKVSALSPATARSFSRPRRTRAATVFSASSTERS